MPSEAALALKDDPGSGKARVSSSVTRLKFWGVRGSIPTPGPGTVHYGGNTSCLEVRAAGQHIILDAGTGLRLLGRELQAEFGEQPLELTLLLTHTHWDHIQGLPFFAPVYQPQNHLRILGYEGASHRLESVLLGQMELPVFPVALREVPANVKIEELASKQFALGQVQVEALQACHPGTCVGYRLNTPAGSIAFFPDNEVPCIRNGTGPHPDAADPGCAENKNLEAFIRGVDIVVMDAQYDAAEYQQHIGWGHGCAEAVVDLALRSQVKKLLLFHHDPDHDDEKVSAMVTQARNRLKGSGAALEVDAAREGAEIELRAPAVRS